MTLPNFQSVAISYRSTHEALGLGMKCSITWLQSCLPLLPFVNFLFFLKKRNFFLLMFNDSYFSYKVWRRQWHPTPVLLPGKSHGRRSLVGCSPWGRQESDTTERLHFHFSLSCTGEGNGNPLQCSCLENPRDGGAWWAAVYGDRVGHD